MLARMLPMESSGHLQAAEHLAKFLDNSFEIFGIQIGAAAFLDLIPEVGDFLIAFLSLYIVWIALENGVSKFKIIQMLWNIFVSLIIGLIPIFGDVAYIFRKANMKNLQILKSSLRSVPV